MSKQEKSNKFYCVSYKMAKYLHKNGHPILRSFPSRNGVICYEFDKSKLLQSHIEEYKDMIAYERYDSKMRVREAKRKRAEADQREKRLGLQRGLS